MEAALVVAKHIEKYRTDNPQLPQASSGGKRPVGAPSVKRRKKNKDGFGRKSYEDIKKEEEAEGFLTEESDEMRRWSDEEVEVEVEQVEVEVEVEVEAEAEAEAEAETAAEVAAAAAAAAGPAVVPSRSAKQRRRAKKRRSEPRDGETTATNDNNGDKCDDTEDVEARGATTESLDVDTWAQCDSCNKWRRVPAAAFPLPARWFCEMNPARCAASDGGSWSCAVPEALEEEDHVAETVAADGCYVVERLLAKRKRHREVQYLVRWAGFTEASDTWEPAANIGKEVIESFDRGQTASSPPRAEWHLCCFHDCGKAFPDASALRKHMYSHGEKQYICQVEVRRQPAPAVSPWLVRALSRRPSPPFHPHPPLSLAGVRQAVPRQLQTEATLAHAHGGAASPLPLRGVREALLASLQPALAHVHPHGRAPVRVLLSRRGARSTRRARRVRHARGPPRLPQPTRPPQRAAAPVLPRAPALTLMRSLSLSCGQAATSGMRRRTPWRRT